MTSSKPHVLIIGAGITGLLLAQALRKNGISYSIYERDPEATSRGFGWGLAIHWAKLDLIGLLPEELQDGWLKASVDAHATVPGQSGRFPFFDLSTGQKRFSIESTERVRLSRKGLRDLLATDLMINVRS